MGQMSAVIQIHTHNGIAGLQHSELHCHICLCSGMWLYISIITAKQLFRSLDRDGLYNIDTLASAVVTFSRISLRIFVG